MRDRKTKRKRSDRSCKTNKGLENNVSTVCDQDQCDLMLFLNLTGETSYMTH